MLLNEGRDVHLVIERVHDGDASLVRGQLAFRPNRSGRPELATRALIDGELVSINQPEPAKGAPGFFEARVKS